MATHELVEMERDGWRALSAGGEAVAEHFGRVLADEMLMILPGGLVDDRQDAIDSMRGAPWDDFEIFDERVLELDSGAVVVVYRAKARRAAQHYEAILNSTYVHQKGTWNLVLHQQTPL